MTTICYTAEYIPAAWLTAHGFEPQRLAIPVCPSSAESKATRGICPFAHAMHHALISACQQGQKIVLGTHCDQMRRLGELAMMEKEVRRSLFIFQMPATWKTKAAQAHYRDELHRLSRFLVAAGGSMPDDKQLRETINSHIPAVSRGVYPRASAGGKNIEAPDSSARGQAPRLTTTQEKASGEIWPRIALLSGDSITTSPSLAELIEEAGGQVVLDATDSGERTQPAPPDVELLETDPFEALAKAHFDRIADTFRRPNEQLYDWLDRRMAEEKVQGLILHRYVWCDLWHAEVARLKQWSDLPVLELDDDGQWSPSLQTRLEAFLEAVSA